MIDNCSELMTHLRILTLNSVEQIIKMRNYITNVHQNINH